MTKTRAGRPLIGNEPSITERFRIPQDVAARFQEYCDAVEKTKSEVIRSLIDKWMRQIDAVARARKGGSK